MSCGPAPFRTSGCCSPNQVRFVEEDLGATPTSSTTGSLILSLVGKLAFAAAGGAGGIGTTRGEGPTESTRAKLSSDSSSKPVLLTLVTSLLMFRKSSWSALVPALAWLRKLMRALAVGRFLHQALPATPTSTTMIHTSTPPTDPPAIAAVTATSSVESCTM